MYKWRSRAPQTCPKRELGRVVFFLAMMGFIGVGLPPVTPASSLPPAKSPSFTVRRRWRGTSRAPLTRVQRAEVTLCLCP